MIAAPIAAQRPERLPHLDSALADSADAIDKLVRSLDFDSASVLTEKLLRSARRRDDPVFEAHLLGARGRIQNFSGNSAAAVRTLAEATALAESIPDTLIWMDALGFKAFAHARLGQVEALERCGRQRLKLALIRRDEESEAWARTAIGFADLLKGDNESARDEYTMAVDLFGRVGELQWSLIPLTGLGRSLSAMGHNRAARDCYRRVLKTAREIGDRYNEGHALNNLGAIEYDHGDMGRAAEYFESAFAVQKTFDDPHSATISATNVALARGYLGQYGEAEAILSEAAVICERYGYEQSLVSVLNELGAILLLQDRPHSAAATFRRALANQDKTRQLNRLEATMGLCDALARLDSVDVAIALLDECIGDPSRPSDPSHDAACLQYAQLLREHGEPDRACQIALGVEERTRREEKENLWVPALFELAACYSALGDAARADVWLQEALGALDEKRASISTHEWREAYGHSIHAALTSGVRTVLDNDDVPYARRLDRLFNIFQRFKARTLADRITEPRRGAADRTPPEFTTLSLTELQRNVLDVDELLLDFTVGADATYLFAVTTDEVRLLILPGAESHLAERVDLYAASLAGAPGETHASEAILERMRESLGDEILGDIVDILERSRYVTVAPDGFFHAVPFRTLLVPLESGGVIDLMQDALVVRIPSASLLAAARATPGATSPDVRLLALAPMDLQELHGVRREIADLDRAFAHVSVLHGRPLEPEQALAHCNVIHVTGHVHVNDEMPWQSGILLGETQDPAGDARTVVSRAAVAETPPDGNDAPLPPSPYLRAADISGLSLDADLAVVAGCESATGRALRGEGVAGLTSAFLAAGVPTVVATLWPIDDVTTAYLMKRFYRELAGGATVSEALRAAQMATRRSAGHPFYWAGFIVVGDGRVTVPLTTATQATTKIAVTLMGLVVFAWIVWRRRRPRVQ